LNGRGGSPAALSAPLEWLPERKQQEGRSDSDQEAAEIEVVVVGDVQQVGGHEPADERPDHAKNHRPANPDRLTPPPKKPGNRADEEAPEKPRDDCHWDEA
jgi:hypothetical protein